MATTTSLAEMSATNTPDKHWSGNRGGGIKLARRAKRTHDAQKAVRQDAATQIPAKLLFDVVRVSVESAREQSIERLRKRRGHRQRG